MNGRYYWIPFHRIRRIDVEPPTDLRDLVWTAVHLTFANGGETVGLIPTRYAGSETSEDALIRLARKTEWTEVAEAEFHGQGQRILSTDVGDHPLMDVRVIELNSEEGQTGVNDTSGG